MVPGETVYRTGDLVYRTESGDYVYVDRADRVIKRLGVRISLIELGEAMRGLPGVSAAACVAFDDDGETGIVAFVVTDGRTSAIDLRRAAGDRLPETMLPDRIELVDSSRSPSRASSTSAGSWPRPVWTSCGPGRPRADRAGGAGCPAPGGRSGVGHDPAGA